jgi:hypothetical protein
MTLKTAVLPLLILAALAQRPSPLTLIGTVEKVFGGEIQVRSGQKSITLYADDRTTVSMDAISHDLSLLKSGDEISVRYAGDSSGRLIASGIWAKVTTFRGVVKEVAPGRLLVGMSRSPLSTSALKAVDRVVRTYPETVYSPGSRSAAAGQHLEITGLDLGNREVDAVRIAIYNTDLGIQPFRNSPASPRKK